MAVSRAVTKKESSPQLAEWPEFALMDDGLPAVRKMKPEQAKALLLAVAHDNRFKDGQPVVQPAFYERSCQNVYCCGLFWLYWVAMILVAGACYNTGDPAKLVRPVDYEGITCGEVGKQQETKLKLHYPRLAQDAMQIAMEAKSGNQDGFCATTDAGCFYGVCVESCPTVGTVVCSYEVELALAAKYKKNTVELDQAREARANFRQGCWFSGMELKEVMLRCFPWEPSEGSSSYECVEQIAVSTRGATLLSAPPPRSFAVGGVPVGRSTPYANLCRVLRSTMRPCRGR